VDSSLLGIGFLNIVAIYFGQMFIQIKSNELERAVGLNEGRQMAVILSAADEYVRSRWGDVASMIPLRIDVDTLATDMARNLSATGTYGGTRIVNVITSPGVAGAVEIVVSVDGGQAVPGGTVVATVEMLGERGAFVRRAADGRTVLQGPGIRPDRAIDLSASGMTLPAEGSVAGHLFLSTALAAPAFLSRVPIPGIPEAQRLEGDLDLGGNSITGVKSISVETVRASGDMSATTVVVDSITAGSVSSDALRSNSCIGCP
jgi:hypothetical protein